MRVQLRYWRERKLLTQEALGKRSGVNVVTIRRIERGENAHLSTIRRLVEALEIEPEALERVEGTVPNARAGTESGT